jgi:hypothetical protein
MFKQLALVLSLALPAVARADITVEVINNGPTAVDVATAFENPRHGDRLITEGWRIILPGEKWSFRGRYGEGLHLRVQRWHEGRVQELDWPDLALGGDDYRYWPVSPRGFRVVKSSKTTNWLCSWGRGLKDREVVPPDGIPTAEHWEYRRFFRVPGDTGKTRKRLRLEVR